MEFPSSKHWIWKLFWLYDLPPQNPGSIPGHLPVPWSTWSRRWRRPHLDALSCRTSYPVLLKCLIVLGIPRPNCGSMSNLVNCSHICGEAASWIFLPNGGLWFRIVLGNPLIPLHNSNQNSNYTWKKSYYTFQFFSKFYGEKSGRFSNPWRTHDLPVTDPWLPRDNPWYFGKNPCFWGKTWFCPTRDLPVTDPWFTRDNPWFFHGFECAPYTFKILGKMSLFWWKNGIPETINSSGLHVRFQKFEF